MARTEITRPHHDRRSLRHAGDCTDGILIASFMLPVANVGRPRKTDMHTVWKATRPIAATGRQWALPPRAFPPFTTAPYYFHRLRDSGVLTASR